MLNTLQNVLKRKKREKKTFQLKKLEDNYTVLKGEGGSAVVLAKFLKYKRVKYYFLRFRNYAVWCAATCKGFECLPAEVGALLDAALGAERILKNS